MSARGRPRSFDRTEVLRRAMWMFWERGYEAVSLADVTAATGINSPSLYAAFGCKEGLFREAVALYVNQDGSAPQQALHDQPNARAAVEEMLRGNVTMFTDPDTPTGCMIVLAATNCSPGNSGVHDFLAEYRRNDRDNLRARLDRGLAEGDVPEGTDTAALTAFYSTVLYGLSVYARDGAAHAELHGVVDDAMAAWDTLTGDTG